MGRWNRLPGWTVREEQADTRTQPYLHPPIRRRPQEHKLAAPLQRAPCRVLNEVHALRGARQWSDERLGMCSTGLARLGTRA